MILCSLGSDILPNTLFWNNPNLCSSLKWQFKCYNHTEIGNIILLAWPRRYVVLKIQDKQIFNPHEQQNLTQQLPNTIFLK
jgi:hypothetical protein